ncbi:recombinase RecA [Bacillus thuringiensis]|uniref:recombinase RecA n=1 Tax=Bacillus thuringiensis TaxID=1428 RepID=UPI0026E449D5|nr:recombinase RecA [Bacillus thuringiensis]MDO6633971.1 recombinase RecA [Bacillus thuringiensis]MDO6663250.1 recombinase RecA [Bacillus thuringiensis]MDO6703095.1 recombinase RecA [Bacillus thuringiensis]
MVIEGNAAREKILKDTLKKIENTFGKGTVMRLGESSRQEIPVVSTGSIGIDIAVGIGGYPRGRVTEIFGPESSGKTTLALHAIAEVQKVGGEAVFIDAEHAFNPTYAKRLGVDVERLLISQPDNGEQALEVADMLISSGVIDIIVIDSVAALVPKAEIDGEMGESHVGVQARLMGQAMRKLIGGISKNKVIAIFLNQVREKIGNVYGNKETTTGGRALKFYSTVRLEVRKSINLKGERNENIGHKIVVMVVKNKVAPPFKMAEFEILYGEGISKEGEILDVGTKLNIIERTGARYLYKQVDLGRNREDAKEFLRENQGVEDSIQKEIEKHYRCK